MPITAKPTSLPEVLLVEPRVFRDDRGFFLETFNSRDFAAATGLNPVFVQDNHSRSARGVLRGLHYQLHRPQGKLIRVIQGEIFDVAVDLRRGSSRFGQWTGARLSEENQHQLWVPEGFAHGFIVLSEVADVMYKTTDYWYPEHERSLLWNDPTVGITWPFDGAPRLAPKDTAARTLKEAELFDGA